MENYEFDLDDALTLCIYSLLMNTPIKELKEKMNDEDKIDVKRRWI